MKKNKDLRTFKILRFILEQSFLCSLFILMITHPLLCSVVLKEKANHLAYKICFVIPFIFFVLFSVIPLH